MLVVQGNPPGGIARRDLGGACGGVSIQQLRCGCGGIVNVLNTGEEGFNLAVVRRVQAGFDAVEEIEEAVIPRRIHKRVGQRHKTLDPLGVGHGLDIAEVGLAGLGQGVDDFLAVCWVLLDAQARNQTRSCGEGIIEVVDICQKVGLRGCHAVRTGAAAYPAVVLLRADTGGVDQQVLHRISGLGLLGGHGDGAEEDGVDRHGRHSVLLRPLTGEIGGGAIRGGDAAADCQVDVGVLADFGVGIQQHVIQVDPGVVAAGVAVLDLHDDAILRVGRGDGQDIADLLCGTGLEGDEGETVGVEAVQQLAGLLYFRNAGGDAHAVESRTGRARLGHDARLAEVEVPQEAVEEHGVELRRAARAQVLLHCGQVGAENLIGVHAAAGHLRPVAGVGCRGHDLSISGGRRHATQHDRGQAREIGEAGLGIGAAVRKLDGARGEVSVVQGLGQFIARRRQRIELLRGGGGDHRHPGSLHHAAGDVRQGAVENDEMLGVERGQRGRPVVFVDQDGLGLGAGLIHVEAALLSQRHGALSRRRENRVVEGKGHGQLIEARAELIATDGALLQLGVEALHGLFDGGAGGSQVLRVAGQREVAAAVDHGDGCGAV